jgi:hypothetical protein
MYNKDAKMESSLKQVLNTLNEYSGKANAECTNKADHDELKSLVERIKQLIENLNNSPLQKTEVRHHSPATLSKDRMLYFSGKY